MNGTWNPWHGCRKYSEGCLNCYVFRIDSSYERDGSQIRLNSAHDLPLKYNRNGEPKITAGETVYTCLTSDFFLEEADEWRREAWAIIRQRQDLKFVIITKRILRFEKSLPGDWGDGYPNVTIGCTCENTRCAAERLPYFISVPLKHRMIVCEPMLEYVDFSGWLASGAIERITVGGESGDNARVCDFDWVRRVSSDAAAAGVKFTYHQTGAKLHKDGRLYIIPRNLQAIQAKRAKLDT